MNRATHSRHPDYPTSQTRTLCGWFHRPQFTPKSEDEPTCQKCQQLRVRDRLERIELTYRAVFRFPKQGPINPAGFRVAAQVNIEVYRSGKVPVKWDSRNTDTLRSFGIVAQETPEDAQDRIAEQFEEQLSAWRMFAEGKEIESAAVTITPEGKTFRKLKWNAPTTPRTRKTEASRA